MAPNCVRCWIVGRLAVGAILLGVCPLMADDKPAVNKEKAKPASERGGANAAEADAFKDANPEDFQDTHRGNLDRPPADRARNGGRLTRDPVESAFDLPRGVIPRPDQVKRLQALRKKYEPILRDAISVVTSGSDESAKANAAKDVKRIREEIQGEVMAILSSPPPGYKQAGGGQPNRGNRNGHKNNGHKDNGHHAKPHHEAAKPPAKHAEKKPPAKQGDNKKKPADKPPAKSGAKADHQKKN